MILVNNVCFLYKWNNETINRKTFYLYAYKVYVNNIIYTDPDVNKRDILRSLDFLTNCI